MFKLKTIFLLVVLSFIYTTATAQSNNNNNFKVVNNATVGIFPGADTGNSRLMVPKGEISTEISKDFIVTGIEAAEHGKEIVIYATVGKIELVPNSVNSTSNNRIAQSSNMTINQGEYAELTYNDTIGKWVITNIE